MPDKNSIALLGEGTMKQLGEALDALVMNLPAKEAEATAANLAEWSRHIQEEFANASIDKEALQRLKSASRVVSIYVKDWKILLSIDTPGDSEEPSTDNYIAVFKWILTDAAEGQNPLGLPAELLEKKFFPMLNGPMVTDIMQLSVARMDIDRQKKTAVFITKDGHEIKIDNFNELLGVLSVSAKKILNHAILYLKQTNYYRGRATSIIPTVEIPLDEYGALTGKQITPAKMDTPEAQEKENRRAANALKDFKKFIRRDLHDISSIVWSAEEIKGRNRGNYAEMRIISSHAIRRGNILRINFDPDAAAYLLNSYLMQYPKVLYTYDERKPNAFAIAYKIALHNSMDNNAIRGTDSTLSVASLLDAASDIPTYSQMTATGNRNWKSRIKGTLEKAIDESVTKGFLKRWEYRNPKTGARYTPTQADKLTFLQWYGLMVDFVVIDAPDQTERRAAIAESKRIAAEAKAAKEAEAAKQPKRKRGRPRKNKEKEESGGCA